MPKLGSDFISACEDVFNRYKLCNLGVFELGRWLGKEGTEAEEKREQTRKKQKDKKIKIKGRQIERWKDIS